ncbi:hypothetical protein PMZ80_002140 [Knufia obscura]|uniref:Uncharacterized protein n=1 Tax=Knufia obscura TaxID=1635080 RepID=A0ABR0RWH0_9EURO|nr:hypothetical protein PMZ80_002140 [Knufia obscura]
MLEKAASCQSYSAWRYVTFRRLLEDAQSVSGTHLPFLHPKTLHEPRRRQPSSERHYHASSARSNGAQGVPEGKEEPAHVEPEEGSYGQTASKPQHNLARKVIAQKRLIRLISKPNGSHEGRVSTAGRSRGPRDLRSLAQSLDEMSTQLKERSQLRSKKSEDNAAAQPQPDNWIDLPLSPVEKRARRVTRKRQPTAAEREKLANNPWAAMLAGSMRLDAASRTRLPAALLLDLSPVVNPVDKETYMTPAELADLEAFDRELKRGRKSITPGEKIRILPYRVMLEELTDTFIRAQTTRSKKGNIVKRLFPGRWLERAQKIRAYQTASKEYWNLREKQGETNDDVFGRPEQPFDTSKLQWQPDLVGRTSNIMRQRVLLAFDDIFRKQDQLVDKQRKLFYTFEWSDLGLVLPTNDPARKEAITREFWNDMGDIESAHALTGTAERQGNQNDPRPPIAVQPSEIEQEPADRQYRQEETQQGISKPDKDDPRVWVPGSIALHLGTPETALTALPYLNTSSTFSSDAVDMSQSELEHSKYIPPMITLEGTYRLPLFNLPALLGPNFDTILSRILHRHQQHIHIADVNPANLNHVIVIKSVSPGSRPLAHELWQLWRYLGGRDCLFDAAKAPRDQLRKVVQGKPRLPGGLSDRGWQHIHGLLGLKHDKKERTDGEGVTVGQDAAG